MPVRDAILVQAAPSRDSGLDAVDTLLKIPNSSTSVLALNGQIRPADIGKKYNKKLPEVHYVMMKMADRRGRNMAVG